MSNTINVVRLHLNRRLQTWGVPLIVIGIILLIMFIVTAALRRFTPEAATEMQASNSSMAQALFFYLVATGVVSTTASFTIGRALGAGRRGYILGTIGYFAVTAAYITGLSIVLLGLERVTGGWFMRQHLVEVGVLGSGDLTVLIPVSLLGGMLGLLLGACAAASWLRFGTWGVWAYCLGLGLLIGATLWLVAPDLMSIMMNINRWQVYGILIGLCLLATAGFYALMRRVVVRNA